MFNDGKKGTHYVMRTNFNKMKFTVAPAKKVNSKKLAPYVDKILETIGFPEAFVTDESMLADFCNFGTTTPSVKRWEKRISKKLNIDVTSEEYIWELAEKLNKKSTNEN